MASILSFSTFSFTLFAKPKVHNSRGPASSLRVKPLIGSTLQCMSNSATTFSNLKEVDDTPSGFSKNTPHSDWVQTFTSLAPNDFELESLTEEVEAWKAKVRCLLLDSTQELTINVHFINLLCRLGVSYHFDDEIDEQLGHVFSALPEILENNDYDLCMVANLFRVLRQYGYKTTCDVFNKFRNGDGEFKKEITNDVEALLCLYEACFLALPNEEILDEALAFTRKHLQVLAEDSNSSLQKYIRNALMFPSHRSSERLDALHYISYFEEDESANETLMKFAKLDFNRQQLIYKKELGLLLKWWKDENIMEKFPYVRDRLVESHLWAVGCISEPKYSLARMMYAKYSVIFAVMDDTYDTCGTIEELELLTTALEMMTADAGDELPEHMKQFYKMTFEDLETNGTRGCLFEDMENNNNNVHIRGCSCKTSYLKETIKEMGRAYLQEAKWKKEGKAPSFDEYMKTGKVTSGYEIFAAVFLLGAENMGMKEIFWVRNNPEMVVSSKFLARLLNDLSGLQDDKEREDFPKGVDCYIEQHGGSEGEAVEAIRKIIESKWKAMNEDLTKGRDMPRMLLKFTLNYARMTNLLNGPVDMFTYPAHLKEVITSMFVDPLPL